MTEIPVEPKLFNREVEIIILPKQNPAVAPDGYMTLEEFRAESRASLTKILNKHGVH